MKVKFSFSDIFTLFYVSDNDYKFIYLLCVISVSISFHLIFSSLLLFFCRKILCVFSKQQSQQINKLKMAWQINGFLSLWYVEEWASFNLSTSPFINNINTRQGKKCSFHKSSAKQKTWKNDKNLKSMVWGSFKIVMEKWKIIFNLRNSPTQYHVTMLFSSESRRK